NNITTPWKYGDFIGFTNKCIEPLHEGRFEYDWLSDLAERIGLREAFTEGRTNDQWLEKCYADLQQLEPELPPYDEFKDAGVYRFKNKPIIIAFKDNVADPEKHPFPTPSGKIELFSETIHNMSFRQYFPPIPRYLEPEEGPTDPLIEKYPLQLIGWHTKRRCHSVHDNNLALHKVDPQRLWIHPSDAAARGFKDGDMAEVFNDRGRVRIPVFITDRIMKGVVALSQGAWYKADGKGTDVGGCINTLTSLKPSPYARGNTQHTNLVQVERSQET
ncbi:MAG: dimethyl sulfoxide reductase, partial [Clostridia bacterium]|nr:dimethyl sulfoxide reductase [Clostridia bacterium]